MQWVEAISGVRVLEAAGSRAIDVRGVQYDSRRVTAGDVFVAMKGGSSDGNRFIDTAMRQGAAAIITDSAETFAALRERQPELAVALVEHGRRALAEVSAAVFGRPEQTLKLSAVTGTNGKTTTAFLLEQMLRSVGRKSVLMGTIETHIGDQVRESEHTTPESRDVLAVFAEGVRAGCTEVVMEMSSHALEQERVWGLPVDVAIFTNLTQDHLDYHGTMEAYFQAKARIFAGVGALPPRVAVINLDSEYGDEMCHEFRGATLMTYGMGEFGNYRAENVSLALGDTRFDFVTPEGRIAMHSPLSGRVNVENLLAASCAALARGLTLEQVAHAAEMLHQVPGRFQVVPGSKAAGFFVVVDYAHTDDALRNLIALARESVVGHGGRAITLFGCGGDRDKTKRPKMGRAAGEDSDLVVVTSDNPRSEEPMTIINEALLGVRETQTTFIVEEDRRAAIEVAIRSAKPGDIVLLAGKGHEKVQIFADGTVPFDDVAEAERVLRELKVEVSK
ncbi:UDP-N-acetylmuramoyl-L-alanyl-D-glutamate--2,6-diaminopimelate ligase [Granulicella mallensis]|uniref:UDP-N-acetylmuramoyl-L-alanyl-D-glutamate--2,6-diaminopimelate ligase n=1 Tax=Granulicella mallensis (strain ATCC BAA-1857 / DSM 23137 / MP5ACTX8) TaxID=682795 RepID=G8P221_GRAMM|nr:UDP-N-acetylmuramoyl-L-alanyl-D-glutamate--2,6-diaminopimelate ligase [Granulicella mallensis]AEU38167.1 UDP-N-acetylmuramyl-tripeptide synthetase [Granulicella mallensis MP5ACTX8]